MEFLSIDKHKHAYIVIYIYIYLNLEPPRSVENRKKRKRCAAHIISDIEKAPYFHVNQQEQSDSLKRGEEEMGVDRIGKMSVNENEKEKHQKNSDGFHIDENVESILDYFKSFMIFEKKFFSLTKRLFNKENMKKQSYSIHVFLLIFILISRAFA